MQTECVCVNDAVLGRSHSKYSVLLLTLLAATEPFLPVWSSKDFPTFPWFVILRRQWGSNLSENTVSRWMRLGSASHRHSLCFFQSAFTKCDLSTVIVILPSILEPQQLGCSEECVSAAPLLGCHAPWKSLPSNVTQSALLEKKKRLILHL